jgi:hypothetical protein
MNSILLKPAMKVKSLKPRVDDISIDFSNFRYSRDTSTWLILGWNASRLRQCSFIFTSTNTLEQDEFRIEHCVVVINEMCKSLVNDWVIRNRLLCIEGVSADGSDINTKL